MKKHEYLAELLTDLHEQTQSLSYIAESIAENAAITRRLICEVLDADIPEKDIQVESVQEEESELGQILQDIGFKPVEKKKQDDAEEKEPDSPPAFDINDENFDKLVEETHKKMEPQAKIKRGTTDSGMMYESIEFEGGEDLTEEEYAEYVKSYMDNHIKKRQKEWEEESPHSDFDFEEDDDDDSWT